MKRIGGLFDSIWDHQNLVASFYLAARGKRRCGEIDHFRANLQRELRDVALSIRDGSFTFGPYRSFSVRDTKTRQIKAPTFRDRVVHHAIIRVAGPIFEQGAISDSYACRTGRGQHLALKRAAAFTRRNPWYGKIDIRRFYDRVDHQIVRQRLRCRFREARLLGLFDRLIDSYCVEPGMGIPIGALTSQYLGNFYLDAMDSRLKASGLCRHYVRYMDDTVIWGDESTLRQIRPLVFEAVAAIRLDIKHGGEWNRCSRGVPFVGFVVYPNRVRLGREARKRLRRQWNRLRKRFDDGLLSEAEYQNRSTALFAHARHADDVAWRRSLLYLGGGGE
jgi:RNA-directed DNA polymerase